jgi:FtsP/CotA-like multicopper oxidase with cupredoxin domain
MKSRTVPIIMWTILSSLLVFTTLPLSALAQTPAATPVAPVPNPCPRFTAGNVIQNPDALYSQNGVLNVQFSYESITDSFGRQLYCFMTPDGLENPTLHVNPGDTLNITVTNNTPFNDAAMTETDEHFNPPNCGDTTSENQGVTKNSQGFNVTGGSMNIHYHGTNTSPQCGGDNVVKTLVNPTHTFQYSVRFPANEPPGLYWYHPHVHGLAEAAVDGGAAAALVVDGIQNVQPAVQGMKERFIIIRDQPTTQNMTESPSNTESPLGIPQHDLTVNFVPLDTFTNMKVTPPTTTYTPSVIYMEPGEQQFWRVCNCTSDAPLDLQVRFDGVPQTIQLVGIDAVPVNSQDGTQPGQLIPVTHFRIPPASRAEFIVNAPPGSVKLAQLVTQLINSGPLGDDLPTRPLVTMQLVNNDTEGVDNLVPASTGLVTTQRMFAGITNVTPAVTRTVYFEEVEDGSAFFVNFSGCVTASGAKCPTQPYPIDTAFDNNNPPAFITTQGTVEKWIVQNHARENHELHQHQTHFLVLSQDNFEANGSQQAPGVDGQYLDMIEIPFCGGPPPANNSVQPPACVDSQGNPVIPYPQVELLVDFRGPDVGAFVFHCHILGHEDLGMMAIEQVVSRHN